ncbi:MAG: hypothetical protein P8J86_08945 [Phycisphaerales bacterium]|nr:hypothetical protein [Phycisphaerales bacterium]
MIRPALLLCSMLLTTTTATASFVLYDASINMQSSAGANASASASGPANAASLSISSSIFGNGSFQYLPETFTMQLESTDSLTEFSGQVNFGLTNNQLLLASLNMNVTGQVAYAGLFETNTGDSIWERTISTGNLDEDLKQILGPGTYTLDLQANDNAQVEINFSAIPVPEPAAVIILAALPLALPLRRRTTNENG